MDASFVGSPLAFNARSSRSGFYPAPIVYCFIFKMGYLTPAPANALLGADC